MFCLLAPLLLAGLGPADPPGHGAAGGGGGGGGAARHHSLAHTLAPGLAHLHRGRQCCALSQAHGVNLLGGDDGAAGLLGLWGGSGRATNRLSNVCDYVY